MKEHEKDRVSNRTHSDDVYKHNKGGNNLVRLKDTDDLKIVKEDPDVRGWAVLTADNLEIGKVDELIIDTNAMKVRYLVVDLYDDYAADKVDHYMLLPIGAARLHDKDNTVLVSGIKSTTVLNYPVYRGSDISRDYEHSVRDYFNRGGMTTGSSNVNMASGMPGSTMSASSIAPTGSTIIQTDENHIHGHVGDDRNDLSNRSTTSGTARPQPGTTSPMTDRTIHQVDRDHIHGHAEGDTGNIHGTTSRNDIESGHMANPDRMKDNRVDEETIRGTESFDRRHPDTGQKPFGTPNFTTGSDFNERTQTRGLTPRTSSLENKEINMGPSGSDKAEWDAQRPHHQEGDWNDTTNLNSSTSLSNDPKRGSNLGNLENRPQYHTDRERAASPQQTTRTPGEGSRDAANDDFYDHEHFDEEVFYVRRKRREE